MSLERQALDGVKWSAAAKLLTQAISWAVTLIVIRLLVPGDYGLMAMSAVVMTIFAGLAELGLGASLVQARTLQDRDIARVAGMLVLLNGVCFATVWLIAPLLANAFGHSRLELIIQISSVQFVLAAAGGIPEALAYREMRFKWLATTNMISGVATSAATLALALAGAGVWALVLGNLAGSAVRSGILVTGGTVVWPTFALRGVGQFLKFGGAWSGARFAWQLTYQADVVIAGRFLSQEAIGVYAVAVQLANLPLQKAMGIINQVAFSAIAKLQSELSHMRRRIVDGIRLLGVGAIPVLWGVGAVAPEFVHVLLGEQWGPVVVPLQVVALVGPLRMLATLLATAVSAVGRSDVELVNTLVSLVIFVVAFLVGVRWGVNGLAFAYAGAVALSFIATFTRTARVVGIPLHEIGVALRGPAIAGAAMMIIVMAARLLLADVSEMTRLPALIAMGAATYLGVLWVLDRQLWTDAIKVAVALRKPS